MTLLSFHPSSNDPLKEFAEWFLARPLVVLRAPQVAVATQGSVANVLLYRHERFQVEQYVITQANVTFPPHRHPHVETIECDITGDLHFHIRDSRSPLSIELSVPLPDGGTVTRRATRIPVNAEHWLEVGAAPGAFLSFQYWTGTSPSSVVLDWDGPAFSDIHASNLKRI
jgi:hypothetical protein